MAFQDELLTLLISNSASNLHINVRDVKSNKVLLWIWSPRRLESEPNTWDLSSIMFSKPGGQIESVELESVKFTPTTLYARGTFLSNSCGAKDISVPFELDLALDDVSSSFSGRYKVYNDVVNVHIVNNDSSENWWVSKLTYLDCEVRSGDSIWFNEQEWKFGRWHTGDCGVNQVLLQKGQTTSSQLAKNCLKIMSQVRKFQIDEDQFPSDKND